MKKLLLSLGSAGVLGLGTLASVGTASAAGPPTSAPSAYAGARTGNPAGAANRFQSRLDQAVTNGQLTSAQRSSIQAEFNQLRTSLKGTSSSDRRTAAHDMHSQLAAWAAQHGIPAQFVAGFGHQTQK